MNDQVRRLMGGMPTARPSTAGPAVQPVQARVATVAAKPAQPADPQAAKIAQLESMLAELKRGVTSGRLDATNPNPSAGSSPNPDPNPVLSLAGMGIEERTDLPADNYEPLPGSEAADVNKTGSVRAALPTIPPLLNAVQPPPDGPANLQKLSENTHRWGVG